MEPRGFAGALSGYDCGQMIVWFQSHLFDCAQRASMMGYVGAREPAEDIFKSPAQWPDRQALSPGRGATD
jgi:hypothetical protein